MKIQSPWMGRVRGSAGQMTGCKTYDKNVLRAKAFEVSNPNTAAQQSERSFFAQVMQCVSSVTEDELRTLFGVKPKNRSRRNELTSQIANSYDHQNPVKEYDLREVESIGNGPKVNTPLGEISSGVVYFDSALSPSMFNLNGHNNAQVVVVLFDTSANSISLFVPGLEVGDCDIDSYDFSDLIPNFEGFCYFTCEINGERVYDKPFGSYAIKTRAI